MKHSTGESSHEPRQTASRRDLACALVLVSGALQASCIAHPQGLGPVAVESWGAGAVGAPEQQMVTVALSGGPSASGGVVQGRVSTTIPAERWFAADLGLVLTGLSDADSAALHEAQGSSFNIGGLPYVAPTFYLGPVHLRGVFFGIGGGGPEGLAGAIGLLGGSVGLHLDELAIYAGALATATYGLAGGHEFDSSSFQIPIGICYHLPLESQFENRSLFLGFESVYRAGGASRGGLEDDHDAISVLGQIGVWLDVE